MKKIILALALLSPLTSFAMAGVVQVNNTVQNIQGIGTLKPANMSSVITYKNSSLTQSGDGAMQLYNLDDSNTSPTDYEVTAPFIPNYEYTMAGDCKGSVTDDKVKMCILQWTDTGPAQAPVIRVEPVISQPDVQAPVTASSIAPQENPETIIALQNQLIGLLLQLIDLLNAQLAAQPNGYQTI